MATLKKQKGGTFVGFIIGLIIGLLIAVVVALMVTKTPIPFAGRNSKPATPPTPATVAAPAADPNQSLYGNRDTTRPIIKDTPAGEPSPAVASDEIAKPAVVPPSANVLPAKPAESAAPDTRILYYLQAGAFRNKSEAENMRGNLALLGFESHISEASSNTGTLYRVRLGPYKGNPAVRNAQNKLKQNGINTTITR